MQLFIPADEFGIVSYKGKNYYLPALSKMHDDKDEMFLTEKKFKYKNPQLSTHNSQLSTTFNQWCSHFTTVYGDKGMPTILYYIASLFRDHIIKVQGGFPILNLYGQKGSGKDKMTESIMAMFGEPQEEIMLAGESTGKGFMRKLAQLRNAIVAGNEYKNSINPRIIENLKNVWDGVGYTRANMSNDFGTNTTPINSSIILAGQEMPTVEEALFTRVIMLVFTPGKFTQAQRDNLAHLKDLEAHGLSYLTAEVLQHRRLITAHYKEHYKACFKEVSQQINNPEVIDRMILNVSCLLATYKVMSGVISFPFTYMQLRDFLVENLTYQHRILIGNDAVAKWWQTVEQLAHQGLITEGRDYLLDAGYLFIRTKAVHPLYLKELRNRGDAHFLTISTLVNYIETDKTVFVSHTKKVFADTYTTCHQVRYDKLNIDLIRVGTNTSENSEQHLKRIEEKTNAMTLNGSAQPELPLADGGDDAADDLPF